MFMIACVGVDNMCGRLQDVRDADNTCLTFGQSKRTLKWRFVRWNLPWRNSPGLTRSWDRRMQEGSLFCGDGGSCFAWNASSHVYCLQKLPYPALVLGSSHAPNYTSWLHIMVDEQAEGIVLISHCVWPMSFELVVHKYRTVVWGLFDFFFIFGTSSRLFLWLSPGSVFYPSIKFQAFLIIFLRNQLNVTPMSSFWIHLSLVNQRGDLWTITWFTSAATG